jgi:signal transduction histidine kinase
VTLWQPSGDTLDCQNAAAVRPDQQSQNQWLQVFAAVTQQIRQGRRWPDILQTAVTAIQRVLQADRVFIYQVLPDGTGKTVSEAVFPDCSPLLGRQFPAEVLPPHYHQLYAQGRVRAIANIYDPALGLASCLVEFVQQFAVQAKLIVPIVQPANGATSHAPTPQNHLWGLLVAHHCRSPRHWDDLDVEWMQQLADQLSLALAHAQLRDELVAKDQCLAFVSHELRTPLTSLHSALQILATGNLGNLSEAGEQMLAIADTSTERLLRLVNHVLDWQRLAAGKASIQPRPCDVARLIRQATATMQPLAHQRGITLLPQPQALTVWADADAILQVFINLLSNAIKFSPPNGRIWLTVNPTTPAALSIPTATARPPSFDRAVEMRVQDEGQGIPPAQRECIFERFQQVEATEGRDQDGTG